MWQIEKYHQAEEDLIEIWLNIASDDPQAADKMLDRFEKIFINLESFPEMGSTVQGLEKHWADKKIRFFPVRDHIIFYNVTDTTVNIIRVVHATQDYTRVFQTH